VADVLATVAMLVVPAATTNVWAAGSKMIIHVTRGF